MFLLAMAAMSLGLVTPREIDTLAAGQQPIELRQRILLTALAAPQRRVKAKQHYCIDDRWTTAGTIRRVCRTRGDWRRLGLDPIV